MESDLVREVVFYGDYFWNFHKGLDKKTKLKVDWTINLLETVTHIPEKYFKYLTNTDGLYEIRVQLGSDIFRIFCFFDQGQLVFLANGFQKKTQKTPKKEIEMALKIKAEYESEK